MRRRIPGASPLADRDRGRFRECGGFGASANGDATRVTIDLEDNVQYTSGRIANPERIFFDLHAARLTPEAARANIRVDGAC